MTLKNIDSSITHDDATMPLNLFESNIDQPAAKIGFSDPSFAGNKIKPVHRWVPWIAGFSSEFVKAILDEWLMGKAVVLDPFAGVGTTLVEAYFANHDVVGFEINPYAALATRVKLDINNLDVDRLKQLAGDLRDFARQSLLSDYKPISSAPPGFKTRTAFYSQSVLKKVLIVQDFINSVSDQPSVEVMQLAFAATMVSYSNYSYEPSLGTRKAVGKSDIEDCAVIDKIYEKLGEIISDIKMVRSCLPALAAKTRVINASFFNCAEYLEPAAVDLCITSPPYLNNYHYIRNTRPQLYWLGFVGKPQDTDSLEQDNFGKYWQTVRELDEIPLNFPDPPGALVEQLSQLRSLKQERGIYGGRGWANYAAAYFNDCYRFAASLQYALKPGSRAFVVIGNSILQGMMIPTDRYLGEIAERAGLRLVDIHIPRTTRVGNSIIQSPIRVEKAQDNHRLYESVVQLGKDR
jgi:DNA modification methylase